MTRTKFSPRDVRRALSGGRALEAGHSRSSIACQLGPGNSTITQEVARNFGQGGYQDEQAQGHAEGRRRKVSAVPWKLAGDLWQLTCARLRLRRSPEQISGWLRCEGLGSISFSRI